MIEDKIELSHLIEEFDNVPEAEKKQFRLDTVQQLEMIAKLYYHQNKDQLGILTVVCEALGFKSYPGQSMIGHEDIVHFIDEPGGLLTIIYNQCPDEEELERIKGDA